MGDIIRVDSAALRALGPGIGAIASDVATTLTRLAGALDAEGTCWGSDETGQSFAAAYVPAVQTMRLAFADLSGGIDSIARALVAAADSADAVDGRADARFGSAVR